MRHLTIELDTEIKDKLDEYLVWGTQAPFFRVLIMDVLAALANEDHRATVIGGIMSGKIKGYQISDILKIEKGE